MQTPPPSFATDIKPLFREQDRRAMTFMFDLWAYERRQVQCQGDPVRGGDRRALRPGMAR